MNNYITEAFYYVTRDVYFLPSVAITIITSFFVGATVFNGDVARIKKVLLVFLVYMILLVGVDLSRIYPLILIGDVVTKSRPLAGAITVVLISLAYFIGMYLGVKITSLAHRGERHGITE